jgi:hypothetical protein
MYFPLKLLICTGLVALLSACSTVVRTPSAPDSTPAQAEAAWARVLHRFVNDAGEVDFAALAQDRADLDRYVRFTPYDWTVANSQNIQHSKGP